MTCNCGCHDDKPPATGWRRFVPVIAGVALVGVLIAAAVLKKDEVGKAASRASMERSTTAKP